MRTHRPTGPRVVVLTAPLRARTHLSPLLWASVFICLLLAALLFSATELHAQVQGGLQPARSSTCELPIPSSVEVVSGSTQVRGSTFDASKIYWVCSGANLTVDRGNNNVYYVEPFGRLELSGGKSRVFLRANATLTISWGAQVSVVMDPTATLRNESITTEPERTDCAGLRFTYSSAPDNACAGVVRQPQPAEQPVPWPDTPPRDPLPTGNPNMGGRYQAMLVPVGPSARPITMPRSEFANARHYWVCSRGSLQLSGSNNVVFLEAGASLQLRGDNNLVYVKYGAHVQFAGGNDNLVLAEQGSDVPQGSWGGDQWNWGWGWYGPQGMRKREQLRNRTGGAPAPPVRTLPGRAPTPGTTPGIGQPGGNPSLRGNVDKDKPEDQKSDPVPGDYTEQQPTQPPRNWPPPQHPVGAIGPPYDMYMPARLRLEWLEYLEFDLRAVGYLRCR